MPAATTDYAPVTAPSTLPLWRAVWEVTMSGSLSRAQVERRAEERWRDLLEFARTHVPLYQDLYRDLGPTRTLQLSDLPAISKNDLMRDLEASLAPPAPARARLESFVADPARAGQLFDGRYMVWSSSGTSGVPALFVHDHDALATYEALETIRFRGQGSLLRAGARAMSGERFALVAATGGHFAGVAMIEHLRSTYPWLGESVRAFSLLQPERRLFDQLNRFDPQVIATYPTAADLLADAQRAGELRVRPRELWTGGECLSEPGRRRLEHTFGCRVRESYGASEALAIGWTCERGALHVNADWVILEAVDADHQPVPPGVASHTTLLTNLANRAQPLLRYDLGDSITWLPQRCACGSELPVLRVEGRRDEVLCFDRENATRETDRGVKLLPLVVTTVLEEQGGVHDFELVQDEGALNLRLGRSETARADQAMAVLRRFLDDRGLGHIRLHSDGEPCRSGRSGKLQRVRVASAP